MECLYHVEFSDGKSEQILLTNKQALLYWYSREVKTIRPIYMDEQLPLFKPNV